MKILSNSKSRQKLLTFQHINVEKVFERETELLAQVQADQLEQCLLLWQADQPTLVLPAGNKWPESASLSSALHALNWQVLSRKTGGAPVPQRPGIINLSHIYQWPENKPYSIKLAYEYLCNVLISFFNQLGLQAQAHATAFSYCDGDYNLNIQGKKIVGTAQRVVLKKGGGKIVLAQAFILVDALLDALIEPVNLCYQLGEKSERVKANVHTTLADHLTAKPTIEALYQGITQAFIEQKRFQ